MRTLNLQNDPDVTRLRDRYLLALALVEGCDGERRKIWEAEGRRLRDQLGDLVLTKLGWAGEESDAADARAEPGFAHLPIDPEDLSDTSAGRPFGSQ